MSKPGAVEAAAAAVAAVAAMLVVAMVEAMVPGLEMVERRGPVRPHTNRVNVFTGQSEIFTYMSPNKCSGMHSPFQEENSVVHHKVKCWGKSFAGIYRKWGGKGTTRNAERSTMKSEELKVKDYRRGPLAPFSNPKSEAADPSKTPTLSCDCPQCSHHQAGSEKAHQG